MILKELNACLYTTDYYTHDVYEAIANNFDNTINPKEKKSSILWNPNPWFIGTSQDLHTTSIVTGRLSAQASWQVDFIT